jgi:drug/metabolite transporter (DMT)-like permease
MARSLAVAGLIAANVVWGSSYVVVKVGLRDLSPTALASLRVTLAAVLLWILWLAVPRLGPGSAFLRGPERISRRDAIRMAALGLAGIALSYLLGYHGINLTTATDASLMIVGEVIFTSLLAVLVAKERLSRSQALGIGLGAVGIAVLVLGEAGAADGPGGPARALGDLLVLADVGVQAAYSVAGAGFARRHGVLTTLAFAHGGSLLVWLPLLAWEATAGRLPDLDGAVLASVLYLAVAVSVGAYLLWFAGLRVLGAGAGAASLFLQPLVGAALGLLLLQEPLHPRVLVGGVLVVGAFVLVSGAPARLLPGLRPTGGRIG